MSELINAILINAIRNGDLNKVKELIEAGVVVGAVGKWGRDKYGETVLDVAYWCENNEIIELLKNWGKNE